MDAQQVLILPLFLLVTKGSHGLDLQCCSCVPACIYMCMLVEGSLEIQLAYLAFCIPFLHDGRNLVLSYFLLNDQNKLGLI